MPGSKVAPGERLPTGRLLQGRRRSAGTAAPKDARRPAGATGSPESRTPASPRPLSSDPAAPGGPARRPRHVRPRARLRPPPPPRPRPRPARASARVLPRPRPARPPRARPRPRAEIPVSPRLPLTWRRHTRRPHSWRRGGARARRGGGHHVAALRRRRTDAGGGEAGRGGGCGPGRGGAGRRWGRGGGGARRGGAERGGGGAEGGARAEARLPGGRGSAPFPTPAPGAEERKKNEDMKEDVKECFLARVGPYKSISSFLPSVPPSRSPESPAPCWMLAGT